MKNNINTLLYSSMIGELSGSFYKDTKINKREPFGVRFNLYPNDTDRISTLPLSTALKEMIVNYVSTNKLVPVEIDDCYLSQIAALTLAYFVKDYEEGKEKLKAFNRDNRIISHYRSFGEAFYNMMYYLLHGACRKKMKRFIPYSVRVDTPYEYEILKDEKEPLEKKYLKSSIQIFMQSTGFASGLHLVDQLGEDTDVYGFFTGALLGAYYRNIDEELIRPVEKKMKIENLTMIPVSYPLLHYHLEFKTTPLFIEKKSLRFSLLKGEYTFVENTDESIKRSVQKLITEIEEKRKLNYPLDDLKFHEFILEFTRRLRIYMGSIHQRSAVEDFMNDYIMEIMACYLDDWNISRSLSILLSGYHCDDWVLPKK